MAKEFIRQEGPRARAERLRLARSSRTANDSAATLLDAIEENAALAATIDELEARVAALEEAKAVNTDQSSAPQGA